MSESDDLTIDCLIPARGGSKGVPKKNIKILDVLQMKYVARFINLKYLIKMFMIFTIILQGFLLLVIQKFQNLRMIKLHLLCH